MTVNKILLKGVLGAAMLLAGTDVVLAAAAGAAPAVLPAAPAAAAGTPVPKILVIDRNAILRLSNVGKDIVAQLEGLSKSSDAEFKGQEAALRTEATNLQQQSAILSPQIRAQKERDFNAKQQTFQKRVQERQGQIQAAFNNAQRQVEQALGPVLQKLMADRGANLLFDRNAVVFATVDIDVTAAAIERLDQILPKVKVQLGGAAPAAPATAGAALKPSVPPVLRSTTTTKQ